MSSQQQPPISISTSPHEEPEVMRRVMNAHIEKVFGEFDDTARGEAMEQIYHEDLIWFQPDEYSGEHSIIRGRANVNATIQKEQSQFPGFYITHDEEGYIAVAQNLGIVHWKLGPREQPNMIKACHYLLFENGKVKAFWTAHLKMPEGPPS
ncbi:4-hydroxyphenylpyruvate dioxygenase hemolysin [Trichoderma arundinaceum]|uniref:4-hydroxyphenylpyruvate dioxygenase hemolysin n=1 Tax=Trichoderma arundinaceum TaxID=490622 RepID=A0A395NVL5_TRIAR|nr:4-hydroxyphenylpyruvate dioxygenase hemolysin [Trichoderma arundinaceum]